MKFVVEGYVLKGGKRSFTNEVEAPSEELARERAYNFFGANQGASRHQMRIVKVTKL